MKTLRIVVLALLALAGLAMVAVPAGSGLWSGCGAALTVNDLQLRAMFAGLDTGRTEEFGQVCALSRAARAK